MSCARHRPPSSRPPWEPSGRAPRCWRKAASWARAAFSGAASANPLFGWLSGSGGDGVSKQLNLSNGNINSYTDRAMTLEGDPVPEPGSLLLMTAGCVLIGLLRRR